MTIKRTYRSLSVTLALLGSAGLLSSCGEDIPEITSKAFATVDECISSIKDVTLCQDSFTQAKEDALKNAPRFAATDKAKCEAEYGTGNCETKQVKAADGSMTDMILPALAGFMLGNAMGNMNSPGYMAPQALYRDRDRGYRNSGGVFVTRSFNSPIALSSRNPIRSYGGTTQMGSGKVTTVTRTRTTTTTYSSPSSRPSASGTSVSGRGGFGSSSGVSS